MRIIFIISITLLLYFRVYGFEFIQFDDPAYVYSNQNVTNGISYESIIWAFQSNIVGNWHPITMIAHMIDVQLFGHENAGGHHLSNLILHVLNIIIIYFLFKKITKDYWLAFWVALIFSIHPTRIESVVWVSEKKDLLSVFFGLLFIYAYILWVESKKNSRYVFASVMLTLGLMSKPMLVTMPFVLILFDYWPLNRFEINELKKIKNVIIEKIPLIIIVIAFSFITIHTQKGGISFDTSINDRLANSISGYARYIYLFLTPSDLSVLHPYRSPDLFSIIISSVLIISLIIVSILYIKEYKWLFVGVFIFLGVLFPVVGVLKIGAHSIAERYTYFAYIGLIIVFYKSFEILHSKKILKKELLFLLIIIYVSNLVWQHQNYIYYWRNGFTLFNRVLAIYDPGYINAVLHGRNEKRIVDKSLGLAYKIVGGNYVMGTMYDKGIEVLHMALNVGGDDYQTHKFLAIAYLDTGRIMKAECHIQYARELYENEYKVLVLPEDRKVMDDLYDIISSRIISFD